jgi:hypothetical protein
MNRFLSKLVIGGEETAPPPPPPARTCFQLHPPGSLVKGQPLQILHNGLDLA